MILRDFFRQHGLAAGMPRDYRRHMEEIARTAGGSLEGPEYDEETCIARSLTYEYTVVAEDFSFTIPAMTEGGYFVIQGSEKVLLIQEVKLQSEPCVTVELQKHGVRAVCCELLTRGALVPTRIAVIDCSRIELDTSMIHNDLQKNKSIGMYEVLVEMFLSSLREQVRNHVYPSAELLRRRRRFFEIYGLHSRIDRRVSRASFRFPQGGSFGTNCGPGCQTTTLQRL